MKKTTLLLLAISTANLLIGEPLFRDSIQPGLSELNVCQDNPEMCEIDRILVSGYLNHFCFSADPEVLNAYGYAPDQIPTFSTEITATRLKTLDKDTPFDLIYNSTVQGFIDLYAVRRRDITSKVLGMSELYFPMFEEYLAKYDIPLEMKYLAVVESALNPSIISSAGAGGLWQFMVSTGKMFGLTITSYQDERYDPYKATDAACRYLKSLYELYDDWELALAAYNSGPGNVNKAIRRSGGAKDFWKIKSFLPKETQGYVPAFIAVNYVMNHASEYNIYPKKPLITFFETDTVDVKGRVEFSKLSKYIDVSVDDLTFLNATYKLKEIPDNGKRNYLILPSNKAGLFLANEEGIYAQCVEKISEPILTASAKGDEVATGSKTVLEEGWKTHKVKSGESLGLIADRYNVPLAQIKKWNHIKGSVIHPGQKLKIKTTVKKIVVPETESATTSNPDKSDGEKTAPATEAKSEVSEETKPIASEVKPTKAEPIQNKFKYYTVQRGDTLWGIANKYDGVTVTSIKNLNRGLHENKLEVGQKIKIKELGG